MVVGEVGSLLVQGFGAQEETLVPADQQVSHDYEREDDGAASPGETAETIVCEYFRCESDEQTEAQVPACLHWCQPVSIGGSSNVGGSSCLCTMHPSFNSSLMTVHHASLIQLIAHDSPR